VVVKGSRPLPPSAAAGERILVQGSAPAPIGGNYPILSGNLSATNRFNPGAVTVDEPEVAPRRGKKGKKSRIPLY
jgi:hypothetical protein